MGKQLKSLGYNYVDGIEGSEKMLQESRNIYDGLTLNMVGIDPFPDTLLNKYDLIVSTGCFVSHHFKKEVLDLMISSLKPHGFICFSIRDAYMEADNFMGYRNKLEELIKEKKMKEVEVLEYTKYKGFGPELGFGDFLKEMPATIRLYQKID